MEINIENIYKKFDGKEVLKGVTLKIPNKKSTIILGKSGCGKSVTAQAIVQLLPDNGGITEGSIVFRPGAEVVELNTLEKFGLLTPCCL